VKVTIREVARAAGVSVATVSRVFNDSAPVDADTRKRVRDVAQRLRYVPNAAARSLITRTTATVGIVLPELYGEFFSEVIRGIDQAARRHGYHLLVSSSHSDRSEAMAALRSMRGRVDGLIVMSPDLEPLSLIGELPQSQAVVLLNRAVRGTAVDSVTIDNFGGAMAMVRHLIEHGHRAIALVNGASGNQDARERLRGYAGALREAGIARRQRWELPGDFTEAAGHDAARKFLGMRSPPTAIFAANDSMALGALSAIREAGLRVPQDVAVAGFDDIPIARYANPPLSSVHVPISELGTRAMEKLLQAVKGGASHTRRQDTLGTSLMIRESCGSHTTAGSER
jgi:LacI family transcriptional regulator